MKKNYDGLIAYKIPVNNGDFIATSGCTAMIQLEMVDGVCKSDEWQQQITYVGQNG